MPTSFFFSNHKRSPKSLTGLIGAIVVISLLSPVLTFLMHYFFNIMGPQDVLPLSYPFIKKGMLYQLISYLFIHSEGVGITLTLLFSLFTHMFLLWFAGNQIIERFNSKIFLSIFFSGGIVSGAVASLFLLATQSESLLYGSTPAIFSLLVVWAMSRKNLVLSLFLFFKIRAKTIVIVLCALSLLIHLSYGQFVFFFAEIAGILWGFIFGRFFLKLDFAEIGGTKHKSSKHAEIIEITPMEER